MNIVPFDTKENAVAGLLEAKGFYKPFRYPEAFDFYTLQTKMHWIKEEVPMHEDVLSWKTKLNDAERALLTQLFRFFVTGDVDVGQNYIDWFLPKFRNEEVRMMLVTFASLEAIHADAYANLIDTLGMPEVEYQAFKQYEAMAAKHEYLSFFDTSTPANLAKSIAVNSGFVEGMQLFSTFAILMNFARGDLPGGARLRGMTQIVTFSIRDESLHVEGMMWLFRQFIKENPALWTAQFQQELLDICRRMVELEDAFIDLAFEQGGIAGLTPAQVKQYIRFIADRRLSQMMLPPLYSIEKNPLPWLDHLLSGVEHTNFFENRSSEYGKANWSGSWASVWAQPEEDMVTEVIDVEDPRFIEGARQEAEEA